MPSAEFIHIGREDLAALLAYIKQLPPVELPEHASLDSPGRRQSLEPQQNDLAQK